MLSIALGRSPLGVSTELFVDPMHHGEFGALFGFSVMALLVGGGLSTLSRHKVRRMVLEVTGVFS
jgi:hypothetical protein